MQKPRQGGNSSEILDEIGQDDALANSIEAASKEMRHSKCQINRIEASSQGS